MSLIQDFYNDADFSVNHFCMMEVTNSLTYRGEVLGQYKQCKICGKAVWSPIPTEDENSY